MDAQPIQRQPQAQPALPVPAEARVMPHEKQNSEVVRRQLVAAVAGGQPRVMAMRQVDVQFQVDQNINRVIARIVDSETGEVVREVPPDELVDLARRVTALVGAMLDRRV
jgi:flagellar protein FlaG